MASPRHDEEGCVIFAFVLCEFAHMLEQDASHYCSVESQSCTFMREKEEEEHVSQDNSALSRCMFEEEGGPWL